MKRFNKYLSSAVFVLYDGVNFMKKNKAIMKSVLIGTNLPQAVPTVTVPNNHQQSSLLDIER